LRALLLTTRCDRPGSEVRTSLFDEVAHAVIAVFDGVDSPHHVEMFVVLESPDFQ
jgi:hypothetical protein